jgi:hypothetical protein
MRESCTYGSVRGAPSNGCSYRDWWNDCHSSSLITSRFAMAKNSKSRISQGLCQQNLIRDSLLRLKPRCFLLDWVRFK